LLETCYGFDPPENGFVLAGLTSRKIIIYHSTVRAGAVAQLVEALRYKPEGRVFDSRLRH